MEFKTLSATSIGELIATFNAAFSDYFIKLQLTEETIAAKIKSENILLPFSVGAFENNKLVGFILHGYDILEGVKTIYNAGTGVISAFRGQGITFSMYQYCIPVLKKQGVTNHLLEVIDNNYPAIKIYEQVGFKKLRTLGAYKSGTAVVTKNSIAIRDIETISTKAQSFASMQPSWQNSINSITRDLESHKLIGAFSEETLVAYAVYLPSTGRVKQCAVHPTYRRKGIGKALFHYMMQLSATGELMITNVDEAYAPATFFLRALGFNKFLGLYEMGMEVH